MYESFEEDYIREVMKLQSAKFELPIDLYEETKKGDTARVAPQIQAEFHFGEHVNKHKQVHFC